MKISVCFAALLLTGCLFGPRPGFSQNHDSLIVSSESLLKKITPADSVTYYQCHVEDVGIGLSTASGQTLSTAPKKCSITEKFVISKSTKGYKVRYYVSSLTVFPNRKFSGLKIREKDYWNFSFVKEQPLTYLQLQYLLALEKKGREATEYDYTVSKYTTNQVIVKHKKDFSQLILEGDYRIQKLVKD